MSDSRDDSRRGRSRADRNRTSMIRVGLVLTTVVLLASNVSRPLFGPTLHVLLAAAAVTMALVATALRQRLFADHLTGWDECAVLLLATIVCGAFPGGTIG